MVVRTADVRPYLNSRLIRDHARPILDLISTKHLFIHPLLITQLFGVRCYVTCLWRSVFATGPVTNSKSACRGLATNRMPSPSML